MPSHLITIALFTTGLSAGVAMWCAMMSKINQIKTVPVRTGQRRRAD
jgi:formate-dependent nitrite reductase membrane component NrfD